MAYVQDDNQDRLLQQQQQQAVGSNGVVLSSPSAAMTPAAPGIGGTAPKAPASNQSGMFTNLQSYLGANAGEGQRMAGAAASVVAGDAAKADKGGNDWHDAAAKQIADSTVQDTAGLTNTLKNGSAKDLSNINDSDFRGLWNAQYQAPTIDYNTDKYAPAYDRVQQEGKLAGGDTAARSTLLRNTLVEPGQQYTKGENLLDSWLTGASPDKNTSTDNAFAGVANNYTKYGDKLGALGNALNTQETAARQASDNTRQSFRDTATARQGSLQSTVDTARSKAAAANKHVQDLTTAAKSSDMATKLAALRDLGYNDDVQNGVKFGVIDPAALLGQTYDYAAGDYLGADDRGAYTHLNDLLTGVGGTVGDNNAVTTSGLDINDLGAHAGYDPNANATAPATVSSKLIDNARAALLTAPPSYTSPAVTTLGIDSYTPRALEALNIDPAQYIHYDPNATNGVTVDVQGAQQARLLAQEEVNKQAQNAILSKIAAIDNPWSLGMNQYTSNFFNQQGIDWHQFIKPDPLTPAGYSLDRSAMDDAYNAAHRKYEITNPFLDDVWDPDTIGTPGPGFTNNNGTIPTPPPSPMEALNRALRKLGIRR